MAIEGAAPAWSKSIEMARSLRLLLVEDHQDSADLLAEILSSHGYSVAVATCAKDALSLAERQDFDVLLSDLGLPDATGYELMTKIRELHASMKGIAITGSGGADALARGRQAGFSAHLTKPVTVRRLEEAIANLGV